MPFDSRWQSFPAAKPIVVTGGIATTKLRGAMASTWWSKRFVDVLDSYGLGGRMTRGRAYARKGQVISLKVSTGVLSAEVQGSRSRPYTVTVKIQVPSAVQWDAINDALRSRLGFAARLLAGEIPADLEDVFSAVGAQLFPRRWSDLKAACSCPDWGDPCKHQAAVLYVFADQLDQDPWRLLTWHGRTREDILALFAGESAASSATDEIAPWWPLRPRPTTGAASMPIVPAAEPAEPPHAVLARLGNLDATIDGIPVTDLLKVAYEPSDGPSSTG